MNVIINDLKSLVSDKFLAKGMLANLLCSMFLTIVFTGITIVGVLGVVFLLGVLISRMNVPFYVALYVPIISLTIVGSAISIPAIYCSYRALLSCMDGLAEGEIVNVGRLIKNAFTMKTKIGFKSFCKHIALPFALINVVNVLLFRVFASSLIGDQSQFVSLMCIGFYFLKFVCLEKDVDFNVVLADKGNWFYHLACISIVGVFPIIGLLMSLLMFYFNFMVYERYVLRKEISCAIDEDDVNYSGESTETIHFE